MCYLLWTRYKMIQQLN